MLAISGKLYEIPIKCISDTKDVYWSLVRRNSDGEDRIEASKFSYTFDLLDDATNIKDRFTAIYDHASVKPAPRSLRIFGAERCSKLVSGLSNCTKKIPWDNGNGIILRK
jgi:hypothetical protein